MDCPCVEQPAAVQAVAAVAVVGELAERVEDEQVGEGAHVGLFFLERQFKTYSGKACP
jgi:hypothetical protein